MKDRKIFILDYGSGNIGSLLNMFRHIGAEAEVISHPVNIGEQSALVLPGVGHFGYAAEKLKTSGFAAALVEQVHRGIPLLGVCVGMQLLFDYGREGEASGLGLISGQVRHFDRDRFTERLPLPNIGWRYGDPVNEIGKNLLSNMPRRPRFYFVHSYHAECVDPSDIIMQSDYGYRFTSGVARRNVVGFQFHPEKSHTFGMTLLSNWIKYIND